MDGTLLHVLKSSMEKVIGHSWSVLSTAFVVGVTLNDSVQLQMGSLDELLRSRSYLQVLYGWKRSSCRAILFTSFHSRG